MSAEVAVLRETLARRFPDALPARHGTTEVAPIGVGEMDAILPGGGLPRGKLSVWAPGGADTALLRAACMAALARGERAAWVDGPGVLTGEGWPERILLARPRSALDASACAEELIRSGGFGLVVLVGGEEDDAVRLRISRAAKEGGGALVALSPNGFMGGLALSSRILPTGCRWARGPFGEPARLEAVRIRVEAVALGWRRHAHLMLSLQDHAHRITLEPGLADRRGGR
jgi:hypothetical protein